MLSSWLVFTLAAWVQRDDAAARRALDGDVALREEILAAVTVERSYVPVDAGGRRFYLRGDGQAGHLRLLVDEGGTTRTLVGDGPLSTFFWPSPDGTRVAYGVQTVGETGLTLHLLDVATGRDEVLPEKLRRGLPLVAWSGGRLHLVPLGAARVVAAGKTVFEGGDEITDLARRDGRDDLVVTVRRGEHERVALLSGETLIPDGPGSFRYAGEHRGAPVFATTRGAPRGRVVTAHLEELVPEGDAVIETWPGPGRMATVSGGTVYLVLRDGGLARLRRHPLDGSPASDIELPGGGVMWSGLSPVERGLAFSLTGFVDPGSVYQLDTTTGALTTWARPRLPYDASEIVTERLTYPSGVGPAPMLLVRHRATPRDGKRPTLIYGYAFGGWIAGPWFRPHLQAWLRAGGLFAVPALRRGAGIHRQDAIDDFLAASAQLVREGWTGPGHLIAEGQSVGGSVAAMAVIQAPKKFGGLILAHPVLDLLGFHHEPAGKRWLPELGDPDDPAVRPFLRRVSPVHALRRGCYPPTLTLPSERDPTAAPWHGLHFHRALRAAQTCARPVLLRMAWGADHTYGRDAAEVAASYAAQLVFAWRYGASNGASTRMRVSP